MKARFLLAIYGIFHLLWRVIMLDSSQLEEEEGKFHFLSRRSVYLHLVFEGSRQEKMFIYCYIFCFIL